MRGINNDVHAGAHAANPQREVLTQLMQPDCNCLQHKRLYELPADLYLQGAVERRESRRGSATLLKRSSYCPQIQKNARCRRKARGCMHGLNEKRCESEWCPPFWILISFADTPHTPHTFLFSTNPASSHAVLPRSFLSHRSVLETGYEGLCYLITDQRVRENERGRKKTHIGDAKRRRNWTEMRRGGVVISFTRASSSISCFEQGSYWSSKALIGLTIEPR